MNYEKLLKQFPQHPIGTGIANIRHGLDSNIKLSKKIDKLNEGLKINWLGFMDYYDMGLNPAQFSSEYKSFSISGTVITIKFSVSYAYCKEDMHCECAKLLRSVIDWYNSIRI